MKKQTKENVKEGLINDLIILSRMSEDLWVYHPDNEDRIDIVTSYNNIQSKIKEIEMKVEELD